MTIQCVHADLTAYEIGEKRWDGIVFIFCPLPSALRTLLHKQVITGLKPGGIFFLEAYTPEQLKYGTGGGSSADAMVSKASLIRELEGLRFIHLIECKRNIVKGI